MAKLKYKMLHVSVGDDAAWELLSAAYASGWRIEWSEYASHQFHFLLVGDSDAS